MDDAETEERELEETESLLEYYLQRAANTQSEAERLLAGARDLEESIGVSLSARRFEVCAHVLKSTRSPTRAVAIGYHNRSTLPSQWQAESVIGLQLALWSYLACGQACSARDGGLLCRSTAWS